MRHLAAGLLGIVVLASGCSRQEVVLFSVNGNAFTQTMLTQQTELQLLMRQARRSVTDEVKVAQARKNLTASILKSRIPSMLVLQEAEAAGATADARTVAEAEGAYARRIGRRADEFGVLAGMAEDKGLGRALREKMREELVATAYLRQAFSNELSVSDDLLRSTLEDMRRGDERARATNVVICALATNLWRRASGGEDFAKLADAYSQEEGREPGGDMGEQVTQEFFAGDAPGVWNVVSRLRPGEISPPLDTSEGLMVFKCIGRTESEQEGLSMRLARIVLYRALLYENHDPEFVRRSLAHERRGKVVQGIVDRQMARSEIVFTPEGEKILGERFAKGWRERFDRAHGRTASDGENKKKE